MFSLIEIKKASDGLSFERELVVKDQLMAREPEVLDLSPVTVTGRVYKDRGLYFLDYQMTYTLTLPSSRSLVPVALEHSRAVNEVFIEADQVAAQKELVEEDLVLILEGPAIDLEESVLDNILLNLPIRVLSPEEEADDQLPSGDSWALLTESQYQAQQEEQKAANNPFASLTGLFDEG